MPIKRPTDGEFAILRVLWAHGPSTVRQAARLVMHALATGRTSDAELAEIEQLPKKHRKGSR